MGTGLNDTALLQHDNAVGVADGGQPVRDDDAGAPAKDAEKEDKPGYTIVR